MKRPRLTHAVAIVLIAACVFWVAKRTYWDEITVSGPLQGEAATNPYYSVQHLARALGMRTGMIGSLYPSRPSTDVLLINGIQDDLLHNRLESLAPWVESGGRLIITGDAVWANSAIQKWSGISPGSHLVDNETKASSTVVRSQQDADCEPLAIKVDAKPTGETLVLCSPATQFEFVSKRLPSWSLSSQYGMQVLRVTIGSGSVSVIPRFSLIDNKTLLRGDHAQIFLEAGRLRSGDQLDILSVSSAEGLMAILWRLAAPAIVFFAAAVICAILRELPRLGPLAPVPGAVRRSLAEQIRANAAFAWRTRNLSYLRKAVARALDETAKRKFVSYTQWGVQRRAGTLSSITGVDLQALSNAMTEAASADASGQRAAIAMLEQTRRILKTQTQKLQRPRA